MSQPHRCLGAEPTVFGNTLLALNSLHTTLQIKQVTKPVRSRCKSG